MKKIILFSILALVGLFTAAQPNATPSDGYVWFNKVLNTNESRGDYSYWPFNVSEISDTIVAGDTTRFAVFVDLAKHGPVAPMLNLTLEDISGTTDSIDVLIDYYISQFGALSSEAGEITPGMYQDFHEVYSLDSVYNISSSTYFNIVAADSVSSGIGIPLPRYVHARSVFYDVSLIPKGTTDTLLVKALRFKCYVNPILAN